MLIGSPGDADKGSGAGKVEMFDLNGTYIKTIYSNQPATGDFFGASCAIGSTFMLVGSSLDADKGATAGKVEMFDLNGTKPTLTINNVVQTEESSSLSEIVYKPQMVNTTTTQRTTTTTQRTTTATQRTTTTTNQTTTTTQRTTRAT